MLRQTIHKVISEEIKDGERVLDLGCGDGALLQYLIKNKNVKGHGIDISDDMIIKCIEKGLSVIQLDLDNLPLDFPTKFFDIVVLNQTIQQIYDSKGMIMEMLRIGKKGILGFPNFGTLPIRLKFLFYGTMPVSKELPYKWYDTPNIHLLTIKDFKIFCKENGIKIKKEIYLKRKFLSDKYKKIKLFPNLRAELAVFIISKD
ncbi:MAG TPA: methionine biosynthesis protein MetW [Spirochaetota bacterium]|nr:methionine biosynthesis protein MetW [Spirochaetota bacterium]HOL58227.1 methionine biosynthesis protein MetW [Spirochaetota bacterium]HPP04152.1 methionine biosynthesis protein MetW [Spirochaetota bacterium]